MWLLNKKELEELELKMIKESRFKAGELECAACGFVGNENDFYNSSVHNKFKICPVCGTVRFVCEENRGYIRNIRSQ